MTFPKTRLRRLRYNPILRELVRETQISVDDLIYPMFVCTGKNIKNEISSMPGQYQMSIDNFIIECKNVIKYSVGKNGEKISTEKHVCNEKFHF